MKHLTKSYVKAHLDEVISWYSIQTSANAPAIGKAVLHGVLDDSNQLHIDAVAIEGDPLNLAFFKRFNPNDENAYYGDTCYPVYVGEPGFNVFNIEDKDGRRIWLTAKDIAEATEKALHMLTCELKIANWSQRTGELKITNRVARAKFIICTIIHRHGVTL